MKPKTKTKNHDAGSDQEFIANKVVMTKLGIEVKNLLNFKMASQRILVGNLWEKFPLSLNIHISVYILSYLKP